ncbi:unnamed protein product [Caenorhabditis auriculariae]|uniref:Uncharacterized protein n=1 Tax=Caenorhabditis auriculariae TaxID=2777116 RepID=A0A8S1HA79_9PELO|nr:unnamed protein product [Caenorhabditis auriculariae]
MVPWDGPSLSTPPPLLLLLLLLISSLCRLRHQQSSRCPHIAYALLLSVLFLPSLCPGAKPTKTPFRPLFAVRWVLFAFLVFHSIY